MADRRWYMESGATGLEESLSADAIENARLRFFPGWFVYEGRPIPSRVLMPYYRVRVNTEAERQLAEQVKPPYVEADIFIAPEER